MQRNIIIIIILVLLVAMQFIRPGENKGEAFEPNHITIHYQVPDYIQDMLIRACYDCHSDNTNYPWYSNIQPVGWWLANHIKDGTKELNFSQFNNYEPKKQAHKLKEVAEQIEKGEMPLNSYLWIHKEAVLSKEEKEALINWAHTLQHQIELKNTLNQN